MPRLMLRREANGRSDGCRQAWRTRPACPQSALRAELRRSTVLAHQGAILPQDCAHARWVGAEVGANRSASTPVLSSSVASLCVARSSTDAAATSLSLGTSPPTLVYLALVVALARARCGSDRPASSWQQNVFSLRLNSNVQYALHILQAKRELHGQRADRIY